MAVRQDLWAGKSLVPAQCLEQSVRRPRRSRPPPAPPAASSQQRRGHIGKGETNRSDGQWTDFLARGRLFTDLLQRPPLCFARAPHRAECWSKKSVPPTLQHRRRSTTSHQPADPSLSWVETWAWAPQPPPPPAPAQAVTLHQQSSVRWTWHF